MKKQERKKRREVLRPSPNEEVNFHAFIKLVFITVVIFKLKLNLLN